MADTIKISLELADAAAQKALSDFISKGGQADKSFKKLGDTGKKAFNDLTVEIGQSIGIFDIFAGNLAANVVVGAFNAMTSAAGQLYTTFITDGVTAAQESENALNSLNVALAQSGNLTQGALEGFQDFAAEIQRTTAFEDDAVIANTALLASLTRLDNDGLKLATRAAIELSAALGKDLSTTTEAIAKAANGNTTALNKMGIQFEKTGTDAGTFQNALTAIEAKFGGTAASKLNTYSGAIAQTRNAFGDLQEEIGNVIVQNPALIGAIQEVGRILTGSTEGFKENQDAIKLLVADGFIGIINISKNVVEAFSIISQAVNIATSNFSGFMGIVLPGFDKAQKLLGLLGKDFVDIGKSIGNVAADASPATTAFDELGKKLGDVGAAAQAGIDKMKAQANFVGPIFQEAGKKVTELSEAQKLANEENDKYVEGLAKQADSTKSLYELRLAEIGAFYEASAIVQDEKERFNFDAQLAREIEFSEAKAALLLEQLEIEQATIDASTVDPSIKLKARLAAEQKYQTDSLKLSGDFTKKSVELGKTEIKQKEDDQRNSLALFATLANSKNKTLGAIGKSAALVQVAIDTEKAASSAYAFGTATGGPVLGAIFQGIAYAAQAARAANIVGIQFAQGGIVPGTSMTGDKIQARVNSKEMILNTSQQAELFELANGRGNTQGSGITREDLVAFADTIMNRPVVINIDGREVFNVIRDGQNSGRRF